MSLSSGARIGSFEVLSPLGAGGMVKDQDSVGRLRVVLDWRPGAVRVP